MKKKILSICLVLLCDFIAILLVAWFFQWPFYLLPLPNSFMAAYFLFFLVICGCIWLLYSILIIIDVIAGGNRYLSADEKGGSIAIGFAPVLPFPPFNLFRRPF
jgi:TRAP-type C4-dicarboxylate transport system permease small subunit